MSIRDTHRSRSSPNLNVHQTLHDSDARDLAQLAFDGAVEAQVRVREIEKKAESAAKAAEEKASAALLSTAVVQGQFKTIIALLSAISVLLIGVGSWLILRVDSQADRARESASVAAVQAVQASDRRFDARLDQVARDAAREALRLRDEQTIGMVVKR